MSTYTLKTINSYVGDDSSSSHLDYSYSLSTSDSAYHQCTDGHTGATAWCAGKHVLNSITPTVYQNGTGSALPSVTFQYQGLQNNYIDTSQTMSYGKYGSNNNWQYLHAFSDHSTGMTEFITYLIGDNNTHGTPNTGTDNRFDPTYCSIHQGTCTGSFANQDDHAWSEQLVNTITIAPTDTNSTSLPSAETTYSYGMATQSTGSPCPADSAGLTACPVDTWIPSGENDWQDYYHGEFRGFSFCPSCGDIAGNDENVTNVNDEGLVSNEDPIGEACSFTAQTNVSTDKGKRPIGSLHRSEKVWAYNSKTRKMELQPILHVPRSQWLGISYADLAKRKGKHWKSLLV